MTTDKNNLQSALKQLEQIVDTLGNKEVDVESGLEQFKKGVSLIKLCRTQLKQAENEFIKLKAELDTENTDDEE